MRALITGVTGQDGMHLAELLAKDHGIGDGELWGMARSLDHPRIDGLLGIAQGIRLVSGDLLDEGSLRAALVTSQPDVILNMAAVSSPGQAWAQPVLTGDVTGLGVARLLSAVHDVVPRARVVHAGSLARHGPYGAAKMYASAICADWRERGLRVTEAVMGGHHSPLRAPSYLSRKVTRHAAGAHLGLTIQRLQLGWLGRSQDWGWASNFARALRALLELPPNQYVISTGEPHFVREWVSLAYAAVGLDWQEWVDVNVGGAGNVTDVPAITAQPAPELLAMGWEPRREFRELVRELVAADVAELEGAR